MASPKDRDHVALDVLSIDPPLEHVGSDVPDHVDQYSAVRLVVSRELIVIEAGHTLISGQFAVPFPQYVVQFVSYIGVVVQYDDGFGQLGVQEGTVLLALHGVPAQLHDQGPEPETLLASPAEQSSATVEGAVARMVPSALPQDPGEILALQELLPQVHDQPIL